MSENEHKENLRRYHGGQEDVPLRPLTSENIIDLKKTLKISLYWCQGPKSNRLLPAVTTSYTEAKVGMFLEETKTWVTLA